MPATYLVGPRGPEYRRDEATGAVRWYCYDGLGSVLGEVAPDGTLTRAQSYDVYGLVRTSAGQATTRHRFVGALGHPSEDETGLIYMRARYDDPVTGRFQSEDPARDGGNWFAYAGCAPMVFVDGSGGTKELPIPGMRGWTYRTDRWYYSAARGGALDQDVAIMFEGKEVGSFSRIDGGWKHGPNIGVPGGVRGWALRKFGVTLGVCSVIAYMQQNPLDFIAIMLTCAGMFDEAAVIDQMNGVY